MPEPWEIVLVAKSGVLDRTWYSSTYPDVAFAGVDALMHFVTTGWRERRDPSDLFSTSYYLDENRDIGYSGMNPLVHYLSGGWREGRLPRPGFQPPEEAGDLDDVCPLVVEALLRRPPVPSAGVGRINLSQRPATWPGVPDCQLRPAPEPPAANPIRTVAFYLPQFHAIEENNSWWGDGFTEWTNVVRGRPVFDGHHQPHVPGDLGYYELPGPDTDPAKGLETMRRQVALAKMHGVSAFCFYTYWFAGRRLLESPLDVWLREPQLDLEFCVCWANENWTRTWDGKNDQVLIAQKHSPSDDLAFIEHHAKYLRDPRYLRVGGKPLLLVYRPSLMPEPAATAQRWRRWCAENGVGEIVLACTFSFENIDPCSIGFDMGIEFPPNNTGPVDITAATPTSGEHRGRIYDGAELAKRSRHYPATAETTWRGVCPSWDNEARRPGKGAILANLTPILFREWLVNAGRDTLRRFDDPSARLVFINAWNEWAEGAHLEPDEHHGYEWLHAVREAQETLAGVDTSTGPGVVVIAHDMCRNGAQFGSLALARELTKLGRAVVVVALGDGPLKAQFESTARTIVVDDMDAGACRDLARSLVGRGFSTALCNSSLTGFFARHLGEAGADVVGMVHELPKVLVGDAAQRAQALAQAADTLVFPSELVRDRFPCPVPNTVSIQVRPQGLYRLATRIAEADAAQRLRGKLRIAPDSRVVLAVGYGDHRKGPDLLADAISWLNQEPSKPATHVVWVGEVDWSDARLVAALEAAPAGLLHLPGFHEDLTVFYAGADVLAIPSREDPFPSVALEALAHGLPLVSFQGLTGLDDVVAQTGGELVHKVDGQSLAHGIQQAMAHDAPPARASRIGTIRRAFNYRRYVMDLLASTRARVPRVSVVLPNYNYGRLIGARIEQILSQDYPIYELIVLDDASTDGSLDEIRRILEPVTDVAWDLHVNVINSGSVYRQWATGTTLATGDLVWIAEADDVAEQGFLSEVVPAFTHEPQTVLSYCESSQIDERGSLLCETYRDWSDFGQRDYSRRYLRDGEAEIRDCLTVKNTIPNVSATVMRADVLREILYDYEDLATELPTSADWWVYVQVLTRGRVAYSPAIMNQHRRHSRSVISRNLGSDHFREIAFMQRAAARTVAPSAVSATAARDFLIDVGRTLGVSPGLVDEMLRVGQSDARKHGATG